MPLPSRLDPDVKNMDQCERDEVAAHLLATSPPTPACSSRGVKKRAYIVFHGRKTGVFHSWDATLLQVHRFPHARFQGYCTVADAEHAYQDAQCHNLLGLLSIPHTPTTNPSPGAGIQIPDSQPGHPTTDALTSSTLPPCYSRPCDIFFSREVTPTPIHNSANPTSSVGSTPYPLTLTQGTSSLSCETSILASVLAGVTRALDRLSPHTQSNSRDESNWWVVTVGNNPGVYHGRRAMREHASNSSNVEIYECQDGPEEAYELFVDAFATCCIRRLGIPHELANRSHFTPTSLVSNDTFWYVVPTGSNPGVYEGRRTAYRMAGDAAECILRCESERVAYRVFVGLYMSGEILEK